MHEWKAYMEWKAYTAYPEWTEAGRRRGEDIAARENQLPAPEPEPDDNIGAPWFPDCEPLPRAT